MKIPTVLLILSSLIVSCNEKNADKDSDSQDLVESSPGENQIDPSLKLVEEFTGRSCLDYSDDELKELNLSRLLGSWTASTENRNSVWHEILTINELDACICAGFVQYVREDKSADRRPVLMSEGPRL